ncbi:olfactory receptor 2T8-like [Tachyglossus aculeatus]|uniref:olfactory receptor 2T8-like n=1 Tax=Tachyglossus aculeatus TaxID=9261 RepID=UPI0018F628AF|nr:olfactory receptor 2T8-like [Tachyglossus aculeatus]
MEKKNDTMGTDFVLLRLLNHSRAHQVFFALVMMTSITSLLGNATLILLIHRDLHLHTPIYFLLDQLSLMDFMLVVTTIPQMAGDFWYDRNSISLNGCAIQIFIFLTLVESKCFLLAAMAYNQFLAICHPLGYTVFMSPRLRLLLEVVSWLLGGPRRVMDGLVPARVTVSYRFCHAQEVNYFFSKTPALVCLACDDTTVFESNMYVCCVLRLLISFSIILGSYGLILGIILHMRSVEAKKKAFTTCSSHLSIVDLFYGAAIYIYMRPSSYYSTDYDKMVSVFYAILTPVLNSLIYSLKNREVLEALKRGLGKCVAARITVTVLANMAEMVTEKVIPKAICCSRQVAGPGRLIKVKEDRKQSRRALFDWEA